MNNARVLFIALIALVGVCSAKVPDGSRLFAIQKDGTGLRELAKGYGTGLRELDEGYKTIIQARFSPDGSKIVFGAIFYGASRPTCGVVQSDGPSPIGKLFLMNSDGSDVHELPGYSSAFLPVFTPDGKKILFIARDESAGTCTGKLLGAYSINLDGTEAALVTPDANYVNISSDGSKLVFRELDGFYISNADGSDARPLRLAGIYESDPVFNPRDSSELMSTNTSTSTIFTINVLTLTRTVVLQAPNNRRGGIVTMLGGADYSPDGKTVVYAASVSDNKPANLNDHEGYLDHS